MSKTPNRITFRKIVRPNSRTRSTRYPTWYVYIDGKRWHTHKWRKSYIELARNNNIYQEYIVIYKGDYFMVNSDRTAKRFNSLLEAKRVLAYLIGLELQYNLGNNIPKGYSGGRLIVM